VYAATYLATVTGTYTVRIIWAQSVESNVTAFSPYNLTIAPGAVGNQYNTISGLPATVSAGANSSFSIM
jgi:hypothetical protein